MALSQIIRKFANYITLIKSIDFFYSLYESTRNKRYSWWEYKRDSVLRGKFVELFEECYGRKPEVQAIHAGLECGLICEKIPEMDIISVGPEMKDIHTPKERLSISSAIRLYQFLEKLLALL